MYGREIELAAHCLLFFIKSLPEDCYFNVIRFGSKFIPLFPKPVPYTDANSQKAQELAFSLKTDLGGTELSKPLESVFQNSPSRPNKLRRIFVLTDGCVFDPSEVINLVKGNQATTMCNAIGIGYGVDRNLVKSIGQFGNGFVDFVLSGDDMRSKVINQLSKSIDGFCNVQISVENNENIEIVPPLAESKTPLNEPATFYFMSSQEITDKLNVRIDVEGKREPIIIPMKSFPSSPRATKTFQFSFNNENLKFLRNLDQTQEIKRKITQLSIEYKILCPYTAFVGVQMYSSEEEEQRIKELIHDYKAREEKARKDIINSLYNGCMTIFVSSMTGRISTIFVDPTTRVEDVKLKIFSKIGQNPENQRLIYAGRHLEDGCTLQDYSIHKDSIIHLVSKLRGGGGDYLPARTFCKVNAEDIVSIVSEQKVEGCWNNIPSFFSKSDDQKVKDAIQKVQRWAKGKRFQRNENKVVGTVVSLLYMVSFKKEFHKIWELVYQKALKWLISVNQTINWEAIIKSF